MDIENKTQKNHLVVNFMDLDILSQIYKRNKQKANEYQLVIHLV